MNHIKLFVEMNRRIPVALIWTVLAAATACRPAGENGSPRGHVRVAAAADLNVALGDIITRFSASHNVDVAVSYGSSGTFHTQLLNRAPFDMFLSADIEYPRQLEAKGLTLESSAFTYAIGRLVLLTRASSMLDVEHQGLQTLTAASVTHIAMANPEHAPYGRAAAGAMQSAGLYDRVRPKLVYGENVAQAMQFVESGAADAGFVPLALALAPNLKDKGRWFEIPATTYPRLEQGGVILRWAADIDAARALRAFMLSAEGKTILKQDGFFLTER